MISISQSKKLGGSVALSRLQSMRGEPPTPSAPVLSGGAITQADADLVLTAPIASGYPAPTVTLSSLTRDAVSVIGDLIGLTLPNFVTGDYVVTWGATNGVAPDASRVISGTFTEPALAPTFAAGPTLTGTPATGETLTVSYTAAGTAPITAAIRWLKNGVEVPGETGATYLLGTVVSLDVFRADVSLTNAAGTTGFVASNTLTAPDIGEIVGTPVSIADYADGGVDTLDDVITWGSFTATVGDVIDPSTKEMQLNGGSWVTFVGTTLTTHPGTWYVRETTTTTAGATRTDVAGPMLVVGEPAAAPAIISYADTVISSSASTQTDVNMPPTYAAGNVLLSDVTIDGAITAVIPGDWTVLASDQVGSTYRRFILTKPAAGGDTLSIGHSGAGERASAKTLALPTGVTLTLGSLDVGADAAELNLGTSAPTLWLLAASHGGATAHIGTGAAPTGFAFVGSAAQSGTNSGTDVCTHMAERTTTAAAENPSAFGLSPPDCRVQLIGVRF